LFNMDMPLSYFCQHLNDITNQVTACSTSFLAYSSPHSKMYTSSSTLTPATTFYPKMGTFPLNKWGMNYIFSALQANSALCSTKNAWTTQICVQQVQAPGAPNGRTTPPPKGTPAPGPTARNQNNPNNVENLKVDTTTDVWRPPTPEKPHRKWWRACTPLTGTLRPRAELADAATLFCC